MSRACLFLFAAAIDGLTCKESLRSFVFTAPHWDLHRVLSEAEVTTFLRAACARPPGPFSCAGGCAPETQLTDTLFAAVSEHQAVNAVESHSFIILYGVDSNNFDGLPAVVRRALRVHPGHIERRSYADLFGPVYSTSGAPAIPANATHFYPFDIYAEATLAATRSKTRGGAAFPLPLIAHPACHAHPCTPAQAKALVDRINNALDRPDNVFAMAAVGAAGDTAFPFRVVNRGTVVGSVGDRCARLNLTSPDSCVLFSFWLGDSFFPMVPYASSRLARARRDGARKKKTTYAVLRSTLSKQPISLPATNYWPLGREELPLSSLCAVVVRCAFLHGVCVLHPQGGELWPAFFGWNV